ncbi:MAG: hydroxymethylglutaryl-CoA lyase [Myxococcota bacterium]
MALFEHLPPSVSLYEVSPRDGLQNEAAMVTTHAKIRLIEALIDAGLRRIEVASFVSPRWVPQMGDAEEVVKLLPRRAGVRYSALVPNSLGLKRACDAGIDEIAVFVSASETHNRKNVNKTVAETLKALSKVIGPAAQQGMKVRGYVSTVWGCPYEGEVSLGSALEVARILRGEGCYQIALGDTVGVGTPLQTRRILEEFLVEFSVEEVALHMHDTRGTALSNVIVGLEMGIRDFDASVGGLGGCPFAPGAAGNLATEDLLYTLHGMGIETHVDLTSLWEAGQVAAAIVGRDLPGKVHRAGIRSLTH